MRPFHRTTDEEADQEDYEDADDEGEDSSSDERENMPPDWDQEEEEEESDEELGRDTYERWQLDPADLVELGAGYEDLGVRANPEPSNLGESELNADEVEEHENTETIEELEPNESMDSEWADENHDVIGEVAEDEGVREDAGV